jgi:hypothetical protein
LQHCRFARQRVEVILGPGLAPVTVRLEDQPGYRLDLRNDRVIFFAPTAASVARTDVALSPSGSGTSPLLTEGDFSHELAHALLAVWYGIDPSIDPRSMYGTALPDWFDEAVAIWAEPEVVRRHRLQDAKRWAHEPLNLAAFLAAVHPSLEAIQDPDGPVATQTNTVIFLCPPRRCRLGSTRDTVVIVRKQFADGRTAVDTVPPSTHFRKADEVVRFYAISGSLLPFILDRGGPNAIAQLVRRLHDRSPVATLLDDLPGLPPGLPSFDQQLRRWLLAIPDFDSRG